jgi:hypothetical protein
LKATLSSPAELSEWLLENIEYQLGANDLEPNWTYPALRYGIGDCDDFAYISYKVLDGWDIYRPKLISYGRHMVCIYKHYSDVFMFNNGRIEKLGTIKTYDQLMSKLGTHKVIVLRENLTMEREIIKGGNKSLYD